MSDKPNLPENVTPSGETDNTDDASVFESVSLHEVSPSPVSTPFHSITDDDMEALQDEDFDYDFPFGEGEQEPPDYDFEQIDYLANGSDESLNEFNRELDEDMAANYGFGINDDEKPTYTFPDGTIVQLRGVPVMGLQFMQSNEIGKPQPPRRWQGAGMPEPPEILDEEKNEYVPNYEDEGYIAAYKKWVRTSRKKRRKPDFNDPKYQEDLLQWEERKSSQLMRYIIVQGVLDAPPDDMWDEGYAQLGMEATDADIKYFWIINKLNDTDVMTDFYKSMIGVTMPTVEGMKTAGEAFPSDGE